MGAVIEVHETVPGDGVVPGDHATGREQGSEVPAVYLVAAEGVEEDLDGAARPGTLRQSIDKAATDLATMEDVGFEIDGAVSAGDCGELCLVEMRSVGQNREGGVSVHLGVGQGLQVEEKLGGVVRLLFLLGDFVAEAGGEEAAENDEEEDREREKREQCEAQRNAEGR
ncbi:MAG: hypothetical protein NVSMB3_13730 [Acidobacteriaceae bacterium]